MKPLNTDAMTWTVLLGKWVEYAQAALALPGDAEGERWRKSVPHIINLQAVTFALHDLARLPDSEWSYARDKATVLIDDSMDACREIWSGAEFPELLAELGEGAIDALLRAQWLGLTELIWRGRGALIVPEMDIDDLLVALRHHDRGTFAIAQPGTFIMPGEPVAWWLDIENAQNVFGERLPACELVSAEYPRQVHRVIESSGRIVRDVITWFDNEAIDGVPLLLPLLVHGERIGTWTLNAQEWTEAQRAQIGEDEIEVVDFTVNDDEA